MVGMALSWLGWVTPRGVAHLGARTSRSANAGERTWRSALRMTRRATWLAPFEVDALVDRQAEQMAAQAVQPELDRAGAHPVAAADQARLARDRGLGVGDADTNRAAEVGTVGAFVELDQQGQCMAGAAFLPKSPAHRFGGFRRHAVDAELAGIARHDAAPECALGAGERRQAGREMAAAEHLRRRQRVAALQQAGEDHAFQRLVVLGDDEVAQPLAR